MALRVRPPGNCQPDKVHRGRLLAAVGAAPEHHRPDLAAADAARGVQLDCQRLARVLERRDLRQQRSCVDVDRVASERLHERHARLQQTVAEIRRGARAVPEVVVVDGLGKALRDRLEVTPGEATVRRKALGEDAERAALVGELRVVHRHPAADVREGILLRAHRHPVGERGRLADDLGHRAICVALLALADEPRVLGEAAGVEEERHAVAVADRAHVAQVLHRHRLAAARVVRDRHEDDRHVGGTLGEQPFERFGVHVALERMQCRRVAALRDRQVECLSPGVLDVGARRVEVRVVGDDLARPTEHREEDPLRSTALMRGDHVLEREQRLHCLEEAVPRRRAGVALVPVLDGRPLVA